MTTHTPTTSAKFHLWDEGQRHLAAGRYIAARANLQAAEALAWRDRDAQTLARLYLPLLETRRLIRYQAAEGTLLIVGPQNNTSTRAAVNHFLSQACDAGTLLIPASSRNHAAAQAAHQIRHASQRQGTRLETLLLHTHRGITRLSAPADNAFAAGLPVQWTQCQNPAAAVGLSTDPALTIPLPPPGLYAGTTGLGAVARESLITAWEALALKWQTRHPPSRTTLQNPWQELTWLRRALTIDPACEPITMRLIAVAEGIQRRPTSKTISNPS